MGASLVIIVVIVIADAAVAIDGDTPCSGTACGIVAEEPGVVVGRGEFSDGAFHLRYQC